MMIDKVVRHALYVINLFFPTEQGLLDQIKELEEENKRLQV